LKKHEDNLSFNDESLAMRLAGALGLKKLRWSLRRLHCPVHKTALVLEVGSGGNPYPRSNVLLDAYEETRERHWEALVHDRPTVLAFGEDLPFKDKAFDFVIAAHVLEHTPHPEKFLTELQRVARAGYIETPDAFMERINPYKDHRLEVTVRNDTLIIRKKPSWIYDESLVELYEQRAKRVVTQQLIPRNPFDFHVRYYWKEKINFKVVNPEVDAAWRPVVSATPPVSMHGGGFKKSLRDVMFQVIRWGFSQQKRNSNMDLSLHIRCARCHSGRLIGSSELWITCEGCGARFKRNRNILDMQSTD
jgi:SAM-dependent methyltransferase